MGKKFFCALLLLIFISPVTALAATRAMVVVEKATIYADKALEAPIGYARRGKIIWVGEKLRRFRTILPVSVVDKVGYIEIKNVILLDDISEEEIKRRQESDEFRAIQEHPYFNTMEQELEGNINVDNQITVQGRLLEISDMTFSGRNFSASSTDAETFDGVGVSLLYEHRPKFYRLGWTLGFGYYQATDSADEAQISVFDVIGQLHFTVIQRDFIRIDLDGGINLSPQGTLEIEGGDRTASSSSYGYHWGGRIRFFATSALQLSAHALYTYRTFVSMDEIFFGNGALGLKLEDYQELELGAGLTLSF